ncbi:hypothetical protein K432DRAFT_207598 [Lepidopterella palustris CBS 459.81]|uniref:Uncharacterized protein n=1 Tax=Lepidopterella palustris CBS 459.81 TaxID=1314670 RepID=A0A8E2J9G1_9PEZI|nr:hypothetical protein K432DRAFT_207598 [Lepidopterella palustris CBS 459.81]
MSRPSFCCALQTKSVIAHYSLSFTNCSTPHQRKLDPSYYSSSSPSDFAQELYHLAFSASLTRQIVRVHRDGRFLLAFLVGIESCIPLYDGNAIPDTYSTDYQATVSFRTQPRVTRPSRIRGGTQVWGCRKQANQERMIGGTGFHYENGTEVTAVLISYRN